MALGGRLRPHRVGSRHDAASGVRPKAIVEGVNSGQLLPLSQRHRRPSSDKTQLPQLRGASSAVAELGGGFREVDVDRHDEATSRAFIHLVCIGTHVAFDLRAPHRRGRSAKERASQRTIQIAPPVGPARVVAVRGFSPWRHHPPGPVPRKEHAARRPQPTRVAGESAHIPPRVALSLISSSDAFAAHGGALARGNGGGRHGGHAR